MMKKLLVTLSLVAVLGLTGCSKTNNANPGTGAEASEPVDYAAQLEEIHTAVKEVYGDNYLPAMELDEELLESVYGLTPDMYDAVIAEGPMMSAHVDTFIAVHPTEGNKEAVVTALNDYRDTQVNDTMQYPMNLTKLQASEVKEIGDYVFFYMLGGTTNEMYDDEADEIAAYKEQYKIAEDTINGVLNK